MLEPRIKVEGLNETLRDLRRLKNTEIPKAIRQANKEAAQVVVPVAKTLAPVKSGKLARSVGARATAKYAAIKAGSAARVPYAGAIHFGWPAHHIAPNPFLYRATDMRLMEVHRSYQENMDKIAERFNR